MKKPIILLCLGLLVACESDDKLIKEQQEKMVAEQPIENPFFGEGAMAEIEVSDGELKQFVLLNIEFGRYRVEAHQKIIAILRDEDISMESYNSITSALSMGFTLDDNNFSESDLQKYDRAKERISVVQEEVDDKIESKIQQSDFSMDRFMDLNVAANHNIEIMERAREIALNISMQVEEQD